MNQDGYTADMCNARRVILAGLLGLTMALPSNAEPIISLPTLMKVSGLTAGDILNVRAKPSAKSTDIGDLNADQVIEVSLLDTSGRWAQIQFEEGPAWVSRKYLTPIATPIMQPSGLPQNLTCFGTEPFWNWSVKDGATVTFSNPETGDASEPLLSNAISSNTTLRFALGSASWRAVIEKKSCSDGMSDQLYALQLDLLGAGSNETALLSGCCHITLP